MLNKLFNLFSRKQNQRILLPHDDHLIQSNEYKKQLKILTELFRLSGKPLCEDCEKAAFGVHDYMPPPDFCKIVRAYGLKTSPEAMRIPGVFVAKQNTICLF